MFNDVLAGRCDGGLGNSISGCEFFAQKYSDQVETGLYLGLEIGYKVAIAFRSGDP